MVPHSGLLRSGERGEGLASRWYPSIAERILCIAALRDRISHSEGDALDLIGNVGDAHAAQFIDPPYAEAGARLYRHGTVDHGRVFELASSAAGDVLLTYEDTPEVRDMASAYDFETHPVAMRTTHHQTKHELIIGRELGWLRAALRVRGERRQRDSPARRMSSGLTATIRSMSAPPERRAERADGLVTVSWFAPRLGVSVRTVQRLVRDEELVRVVIGRRTYVTMESLNAYQRRSATTASSPRLKARLPTCRDYCSVSSS
jgi:hypothetical protein